MNLILRYLVSSVQAVIICCAIACCLCQGMPNDMVIGHDQYITDADMDKNVETRYETLKNLKGYHYINKYFLIEDDSDSESDNDEPRPPQDALVKSLTELQRLGGLEETGEIDEPTARLMMLPRCGVTTLVQAKLTEEGERKKRFNVAGRTLKWDKTDLTYKLTNYPDFTVSDITTEEVDDAVNTALKLWSDITPLTFTRVPADSQADMVLLFGKKIHTSVRGDPPFDGPGGTLAHAFTPNSGWSNLNGDLHYDDEETFTHKKYYGRNLQYVTAHEAGHALGLDHSNVRGSLMFPYIASYISDYQLPEDDRIGIQTIYGENPNPLVDETPTTTPESPAALYCGLTFSDVAVIRNEIFAFKSKLFWRFSLDGHLITGQGGTLIRDYFKKVPSTLNGIFERWYDEKIIVVKGNNYWQLEGVTAEDGYPKLLSELGLPKNIDGVMHRASTGITYYFKDNFVYEYNEWERSLMPDTPRKIHHVFLGIPMGTILTGAFTGADGLGYLLSGENYYTVNPNLQSDGEVGNFARDFLRCPQ